MRALALTLVLLATVPAAADECDAVLNRAIAETGVTLDRRTEVTMLLKHPLVREAALDCSTERWVKRGATVFVDSLRPSDAVLDLLTKLTVIATNLPPKAVRAAIERCQRQSAKAADGEGEIHASGFQVDCQVRRALGRSGFQIARE